ncbi:HEAT repeat domain-containing protein [Polyangium jinanense]|uniref:HEAT repeat domain-containing protein n=1 Tax=Polyangium jinanense TaxID=2829994 RepID=A0A9X3XCV5_9BACT|nr:HEAT repeat domain-containing protein [Polyangium jinanense]MDC3961394.1 HEAT repeat domain-containing protein [Polyangium jinanense]MDC3986995.1 HEAT repeat domain-containing protein [Polyangium jinanense]
MSYESGLEGSLAIDPPPDPALVPDLRAAVDAIAALPGVKPGHASTWRLTPLGGGLVNEQAFDWEVQVEWLRRILAEVFAPRGLSLMGKLEAIGEDDESLAVVRVDASGIVVETIEGEPDDPEGWIDLLKNGSEEERAIAAEQLGAYDEDVAVPALTRALTDPSGDVRRRALETLGQFEKSALPALDAVIGCLSDENPFVRYWATFALGRMGSLAAPALGRLEELTRDTAEGPRYGAIDALRRIRS